MQEVVLIGSGNLATALGSAMVKAGLHISAVYSRTMAHASSLASELGASATDNLSSLPQNAAFYLIAVKDDAITQVSEQLEVNGIVAHCSGSIPLSVLKKHAQSGVLYPLQTFSKLRHVNIRQVPVCVEGSDETTLQKLNDLADNITGNVVHLSSEKRQIVHLAAVFANNFSNHLFNLASQLLIKHNLEPALLLPLMRETVDRVTELPANQVQTGPAIRGDEKTIARHLSLLESEPALQEVYELLTKSIQRKN